MRRSSVAVAFNVLLHRASLLSKQCGSIDYQEAQSPTINMIYKSH